MPMSGKRAVPFNNGLRCKSRFFADACFLATGFDLLSLSGVTNGETLSASRATAHE